MNILQKTETNLKKVIPRKKLVTPSNCDSQDMGIRYKKAYDILLKKLPEWRQTEILKADNRWSDEFSQQVASLAESSNNLEA